MDENKRNRLEEFTKTSIQSTKDKIRHTKKVQSDYETLRETLETLVDKTSHEVMVPFGSKAFMPGHLVHTNEILVHLGYDYFVLRSSKQATEIVDRRLSICNKNLADLQEELLAYQNNLDFTENVQHSEDSKATVEITEEYDEEKEKEWRKQRAARMKGKLESGERSATGESADDMTFSSVMARLDELEKLESQHESKSKPIRKASSKDSPERIVFQHTEGLSQNIDVGKEAFVTPSDFYAHYRRCNAGKQVNTNTQPQAGSGESMPFLQPIKEGTGAIDNLSQTSTTKSISKFKERRLQQKMQEK